MANESFKLLLFHRDPEQDETCVAAGIDGLIFDLESRGKEHRQTGFDTEINLHSLADLRLAKGRLNVPLLCRIDGPEISDDDLQAVLESGADEIIVPMIRTVQQAEAIVDQVRGRCRITIMIETLQAVACAARLGALGIDRIYVGLIDLHISRCTDTLFRPMVDGVLEQIRQAVPKVDFGYGGLTICEHGSPLPVSCLINDMTRLGASFSFLRRSFYRDIEGRNVALEVQKLRRALAKATARSAGQMALDKVVTDGRINTLEDALLV